MKKKPNDGEVVELAKAVEGRWTLKDQVTPAIQRMNKETMNYKTTVRKARESISQDWDHLKTGALVVSAAFAATAFGIVSFAKSAAAEASEGIEAATKLSAVLKNVKGVTDEQIEGLKDYASALKNKGIVDDDTLVAGIQQLGTFQLQAASIKTLMDGMADLVAQQKGVNATGEDAVNIGNLVGKAMNGQVGALSRVGISFTDAQAKVLKFGNEQQRAAILSAVLKDNVGGVNEALAATDVGKIKQASIGFSDLKKAIGNTVLLIEGKFASAFMDNFPVILSSVQEVSDGLAEWANNGGVQGVIDGMWKTWDVLKEVWNIANNVFSFFKNNWSLIGPIVYAVTFQLVAYKIATLSANAATLLFGKTSAFAAIKTAAMGFVSAIAAGQMGILEAAQWSLNAAMDANPIGVVVAALGALVLAGIYVVNNWEFVKLKFMETWNTIISVDTWAINKLIDGANIYLRTYKFVFDSIKWYGVSIWDGILSAAATGINGILKLAAPFSSVLSNVGINIPTSVDFSAAKGTAVKPVWDTSAGFAHVDSGGIQFSQDSIMAQTQKAQEERDKKNEALTKALDDNTKAVAGNTGATAGNTEGMNGLNGTLQKGVAVNMTGEQIADSLFPRLERHLYGTT